MQVVVYMQPQLSQPVRVYLCAQPGTPKLRMFPEVVEASSSLANIQVCPTAAVDTASQLLLLAIRVWHASRALHAVQERMGARMHALKALLLP